MNAGLYFRRSQLPRQLPQLSRQQLPMPAVIRIASADLATQRQHGHNTDTAPPNALTTLLLPLSRLGICALIAAIGLFTCFH